MMINWGGHSQIKCVLIMLQEARKKEYDYYHLLSGVDIPLKRQSEIHDFFDKNKVKNFLEFDKKIDYSKARLREYHWFQELIERNKGIVPAIFYKIEKLSIFVQKKLGVNRLKNTEWEIFKGEHWFSITEELVDEIIKNKSKIRRTFYYAICADEMYIQTVAMNSYLAESVVEDNLRFIDWNRGTPYVFRRNDYDELCSYSKLFARKFSSEIDKKIVEFLYKYFLNWSDGNMNLLQRIEWRGYKELKKKRLKNITPTIISSNCNGEFIYYDMNLQFRSPTINLSFEMNDYVKMLENLKWYMEQPILPHEDLRYDYPTGMLGDIEILFNHYETFEYAVKKWEERKKRIDWDNLFVLAIDGDGCTYDSIQRFDRLPYKNKVIFTHIPYPEIQSAYYIKGFEKEDGVGVILHFKKQFWVRRYLDEFDYVSFLNGKGIRKKKRL